MATLFTWAAKRSILARLQAWSDLPGNDLSGVQVGYVMPVEPERICVYGGRARSTRSQAVSEHANTFQEDVLVDVRIRVVEPGGDIEDAERTAETIARAVAVAVSAEPRIAVGSVAVTSTDQDPTIAYPDPDPTVTVNFLLTVTCSMLTAGA